MIRMGLEEMKAKKKRKKRNRLIFRTLVLAVMLIAVVYALVTNLQEETSVYEIGDKAPDFQLEQINPNNDRETIRLNDMQGKGVMLNFWGTWCEPCKDEMPYMQKLYPKYKDQGIEIVAVSLDGTELVVHNFINEYDLTFPVPHDKKDQVRELYSIGPMPTTYFIDPEGTIVEKVEGALSLEHLEDHLKEIQPE